MNGKSIEVDPLLTMVTPIQATAGPDLVSQATGFFYANSDRIFLVTNRHVVAKQGTSPTIIRITVHSDPNNLRQTVSLDLPLYEGSRKLWREFDDKSIDVVALELDASRMRSLVVKAFSARDLPPDDLLVGLGEDVLVLGYPLGFHDNVFNLPVIRSATVASAYPVPFRGMPYFLVDARLHPGTSGSPVILKPTNILRKKQATEFLAGVATFLLGVHSHTWVVPQDQDQLGLNAVWFSSLIEQLTR